MDEYYGVLGDYMFSTGVFQRIKDQASAANTDQLPGA